MHVQVLVVPYLLYLEELCIRNRYKNEINEIDERNEIKEIKDYKKLNNIRIMINIG